MGEQVVEDPDDLVRPTALATGVKSTTSANRIDAELNWSAIGCACAFSCSAIELGRMLRSRFSDLACSPEARSSASRRCLANSANSVKTIVPPTTMFNASIVS